MSYASFLILLCMPASPRSKTSFLPSLAQICLSEHSCKSMRCMGFQCGKHPFPPLQHTTAVVVLCAILCVAVMPPGVSGEAASTQHLIPIPRGLGVQNPHRKWSLRNVTRVANSTAQVNIAYFIQVSQANLPLVPRLLSRLYHVHNQYILHFDRKIPLRLVLPVIRQVTRHAVYKRVGNVHIMEREMITYRGVTMILNNLNAMQQLIRVSQTWHYFINLSGSDYPLVSPEMQRRLLALPFVQDRHANFFTVSPQTQWRVAQTFRFRRIAVDQGLSGHLLTLNDSQLHVFNVNSPLHEHLRFTYARGEAWMILTRATCLFMLQNASARKMLLAFSNSQDPSEHFYISLLWNDPILNHTLVPHALRTVYWNILGKESGQHPYVLDANYENINVSKGIWKRLKMSPHFFARKFSIPNSPMLDRIDNLFSGVGSNVNQSAVMNSLRRVENHLYWIFGIMP